MTRINAGVPVNELCDQHLIAEYKGILNVGTLFKSKMESGKGVEDAPTIFTLNEGHFDFFTKRGIFIFKRWKQLTDEMHKRGFSADLQFRNDWEGYGKYMRDYVPTKKAIREVKECIANNIMNQKEPILYFGNVMSKEFYINEILYERKRIQIEILHES